jgi:REP element-mobilizing transposase RayT
MSQPRQVIPGATYLISRRCFERRHLLRPDPWVTKVVDYCLAHATAECGILFHGYVVMSNHPHLMLTDPDARLPEFMQRLDSLVARAVKAFRGRKESFFAPGSYSAVRLKTPQDIMAKLVYTLTNPVAAGLVTHSRRWTGGTSRKWAYGETRTYARPGRPFFDPEGPLPESVSLTLTRPPGFEDVTDAEMTTELLRQVREHEAELRKKARSEGRTFLGMDAVMRMDPNDRPRTPEPRRSIRPHVAGADPEVRIEAIREHQAFVRDHYDARVRWEDGDREVVFPYGTYLMRVRYRVNCHPPPS